MKISKISSNQSSITSSNQPSITSSNQPSITSSNQPSITSSNKEKNVKNIMNFGNMDFKKTSGCGCGK
tara:strand:- start:2 stop:205 length:204 start_codon:yes stop_codon:yes gene_type:complete